MARSGSDEEVSLKEGAKRLGMTQQGIGQWADKAPADAAVLRAGRRYLIWPAFAVWYRQKLSASQLEDFDKAKARKMAADAELAELELAKVRGEQIPVSAVRETWARAASRIRAQLLAAPGRYSPRMVGLSSLPEAQRALDAIVRDVLKELHDG